MKGKLIVIEGTDCSGKETQAKLLVDYIKKTGKRVERFSFPNYSSPTGKIIGGPYLGKDYICEGWFPEGSTHVDPKVSSLYYAADRKYNIDKIAYLIDNGVNVILDRYIHSNMAHQGGKYNTKEERLAMYKWLEKLEFDLLELPQPDIKVFLHMPLAASEVLKQSRSEALDQNERDKDHLFKAEIAYKEVADMYGFKTIECAIDDNPRDIFDISKEVCDYVINRLS
ncbi:MAG: hypothetical protein V8Q75_04360 [Bacilli bacterium]